MNVNSEGAKTRAYWFVGAAFGGTNDQTARFVEEGIWENDYPDKYVDAVRLRAARRPYCN